MSLILEALRKSEAERRRGQAPNLSAELPPLALPRPGRIPAWLWIAATLAVLLLGAAWLASVRGPGEAVPSTAEDAPGTTSRQSAIAVSGPSPPSTAEVFPPVERIATPPVQAPVAVAPTPPDPAPLVDRSPLEPAAPPPPAAPAPPVSPVVRPPSATPGARMPTVAELPAEERRQLPAMKFSMHMWNEQPAQRFVILDGNRYGEGDRIGSAVITTIDTSGVVLDLNGRAVRLPLR
ncbi:MAG: general secretion pathway protein GspB [Luteimonas sp.]